MNPPLAVRAIDDCGLDLSLQSSRAAAIAGYLPDALVQLCTRSTSDAGVIGDLIRGTLLFADITGFTALSERLAKIGREGAEELTNRLNEYFESMVGVVRQYGGDVLQFGGDSLLALFADRHADEQGAGSDTDRATTATHRAVCCGLEMQTTMRRFASVATEFGDFRLSMRIALHEGEFLLGGLRATAGHAQQVYLGPALYRLAEIERLAQPGEVLLSAEVAKSLGQLLHRAIVRDGCTVVEQCENGAAGDIQRERSFRMSPQRNGAQLPDIADRGLGSFLIPALHRRIAEDPESRSETGEHRHITTMFVHFAGLRELFDCDESRSALQILIELERYLGPVSEAIHRHGGTLARISADASGDRMLVFFGAPMAVENPEQRAMACALELKRCVESLQEKLPKKFEQRIAITSGSAFCGNVGSSARREYTVIGEHVNAACRLMAATSPGEIVVSKGVQSKGESLLFESREAVSLRGIEQRLEVFALKGQRDRPWMPRAKRSVLLGREDECSRFGSILHSVASGHGQTVLVSGDAGVGKSRLVQQFSSDCRHAGMTEYFGQCDPFAGRTAYLPWSQIIRDLLGVLGQHTELSLEELESRLGTVGDPAQPEDNLAGWAPLLAAMLGIEADDNDRTRALTPRQRTEKLLSICMSLLRHRAGNGPLAIVIEDAQWMDLLSRELLAYVASLIAELPVLILVVHRSDCELSDCFAQTAVERIDVQPLPRRATLELLHALLGTPIVPDELGDIIQEKTRGNPLFIEETVRALIDSGHLVRDDSTQGYTLTDEQAAAGLPGTIQNLVLSRVDQLNEEPRQVIQVASIFGRTFRREQLQEVLQFNAGPERLSATLREMTELNLIVEDRSQPRPSYAFRHALVHDAIYESVAYVRRREIHGAIGRSLEQMYGDESAAHCEELARHFDLARESDKAFKYTMAAGKRAQALSASAAAADYFERALSHMDALGCESSKLAERAQLLEDLGDVHALSGHYRKALQRYQQCLESISDPVRRAHLEGKMGNVAYRQGQPFEGILHLERGLGYLGIRVPRTRVQVAASLARQVLIQAAHTLLPGVFVQPRCRDTAAARAAIEIYEALARICYEFDLKRTLDAHLRQLNLCETMPESAEMAQTYSSHGIVCGTIPWFSRAIKYQHRGITIRSAHNNRWGVAQSSNFMGISYYWMGRYAESTTCLEKSAEIFREVGDRWETQVTYLILAFVKLREGELQSATQHARTCLELGRRADDAQGMGWALGALAEILNRQGNLTDAFTYGQRAIACSEQAHDHMYLAVVRRTLGEIELRRGNPERAVEEMRSSVTLVEQYHLPHEYVMGAYSGLAEAYLAARKGKATATSGNPTATLREIRKLCKQGIRRGRKFHNWLGYAYRVAAMCDWEAGRHTRALGLFQQSIDVSTAIGAAYDLAMTYSELGRCLLGTDVSKAKDCLEQSQRLFAHCGAAHDLLRVETMLAEIPPTASLASESGRKPHLFLRRPMLSRSSAN